MINIIIVSFDISRFTLPVLLIQQLGCCWWSRCQTGLPASHHTTSPHMIFSKRRHYTCSGKVKTSPNIPLGGPSFKFPWQKSGQVHPWKTHLSPERGGDFPYIMPQYNNVEQFLLLPMQCTSLSCSNDCLKKLLILITSEIFYHKILVWCILSSSLSRQTVADILIKEL